MQCVANAGMMGYSLSVGPGGGGTNTPRLILTNTSDAASISRFAFTIGDSAYNFDIATFVGSETSAGVVQTLLSPDGVNDGLRSSQLEVTYTGFTPGRSASAATDVDLGTSNVTLDFTTIFFNNGALPNASIQVDFSGGGSLSQTLGDGTAAGNLFVFAQSADVPEPSTWVLVLMGVGGLVVGYRRDRWLTRAAR